MKIFPSFNITQTALTVLLTCYVGLILNSVTFFRNAYTGDSHDVLFVFLAALGISTFVYLILAISSFLGSISYKIIASLLVFFSACSSFYMIFYNVVIGYGIIVSVLTTDIDLSKESLGYKFILWIIFTGIVPVVLICRSQFSNSVYNHKTPLKYSLFLVISILLAYGISRAAFTQIEIIKKNLAAQDNTYIGSPVGMLAHIYLPTNWIAALALFAYVQTNDEENPANLFNPFDHFTYVAKSSMDDTYIVIVIGETTRSDHMGILGYSRDTTPLLSKEPNLVYFNGVSCDTATKLSLKCMYTRHGGTDDSEARTLKERNVFSVLKDLGFSSELFALQSEMWFYKSTKSDTYKIREILIAENETSNLPFDDMLLVNELKKSLAQHSKGKHLVILHTKGSHYLYSERYPKKFAKYTPECKSIDDSCNADLMINAFDNSILYVDFMLKNVFDQLRDKNALVIYASDHGESIGDDRHFHATPRKIAPLDQFRVPILFWASDSFIESSDQRKASFANLKKLQSENSVVYHEVLFDSILGCLGFGSPDGGVEAKNNLCSEAYRPLAYPYPIQNPYE